MENFIPLTASIDNEILEQDYEAALNFDKVSVGERCFYFNRFARIEYLPLNDVVRAYGVVGGLNPNQCCNAVFDVYTLRIAYEGGWAECRIPYEDQMREILDLLQTKLPDISFTME